MEFFARAIAFDRHRRPKPVTAPRKPNRRTLPPQSESDQELTWRMFNLAVRLMDVPEARQDAQWWADRDAVLFAWDGLLRRRKASATKNRDRNAVESESGA